MVKKTVKEWDQFGYDEIMTKGKNDLCRCFLQTNWRSEPTKEGGEEKMKYEK